jgi:deoxyadenosine/deoxycytidine kinase
MATGLTAQQSYIVEGNIGAGKSTFLTVLKQYLNLQAVPEPCDRWQVITGGHNLLEHFYADPKRWAYTFQTYAFITRVMQQAHYAQENKYNIQIVERSVFSDRYCFAQNSFELGFMNDMEWELYKEWFGWVLDNYITMPSGFIYLRTNPDICYERLKKRNRHEEETVSYDYLQTLHTKHETWLINKEKIAPALATVPVLVLEADDEFERDTKKQAQYMEQIIAFIAQQAAHGNEKSAYSTLNLL